MDDDISYDSCPSPIFTVRRSSKRRTKRLAHSKWNATNSENRNWLELPRDVMCKIFMKLGAVKILTRVQTVCKLWLDISKDPFLWHTINMGNPDDRSFEHIYEGLCRRAVDYGASNLVEINIGQFATDDLLIHIAHSAKNLRCLRLVYCWSLSYEVFSEIGEKFSQLEEVDISVGSLGEGSVEDIGRSCPLLKSFKFNHEVFDHFLFEVDEEAFAVAKTMTGLRHLQLFGNMMTNAGLIAILDACTHLESLDLRGCRNLVLGGSLGKRCAKQIKDLRLPNDSAGKCPFETEIHYDISEIYDINFLCGEDYDSYCEDSDSYYDDSAGYDDDSDRVDDDDDSDCDDDDDNDNDDVDDGGYNDANGCEFLDGSEFFEHDYANYFDFSSSRTRSLLLSQEMDFVRKMVTWEPDMAPPSTAQQAQQPYPMMQSQLASTSTQSPPLHPASPNEVHTLWIGNLQYWMDENYLYSVFAHTNDVTSVKVIRNKQTNLSEGYGFIEFNSRAAAERVLQAYKRAIMPNTGQSFKLNWATFSTGKRSQNDDRLHYTIFVGNLAANVTDYLLQETFRTHYNSVKGATVVIDRLSHQNKGYGFVSFTDESEQMRAMTEMQGVICSTRPMRIGPATNKKSATTQSQPKTSSQNSPRSHNKNDSNNTTIFVGNLDRSVTDDHLRRVFSQYGEIVHVKMPAGKQYGFAHFADRSCAEEALMYLNGTLLGGRKVRLSWGHSSSN